MSPKTGRPIKGKTRRDKSLQLRLSEQELADLDLCAAALAVSRTDIISQGISLVKASLGEKKE